MTCKPFHVQYRCGTPSCGHTTPVVSPHKDPPKGITFKRSWTKRASFKMQPLHWSDGGMLVPKAVSTHVELPDHLVKMSPLSLRAARTHFPPCVMTPWRERESLQRDPANSSVVPGPGSVGSWLGVAGSLTVWSPDAQESWQRIKISHRSPMRPTA